MEGQAITRQKSLLVTDKDGNRYLFCDQVPQDLPKDVTQESVDSTNAYTKLLSKIGADNESTLVNVLERASHKKALSLLQDGDIKVFRFNTGQAIPDSISEDLDIGNAHASGNTNSSTNGGSKASDSLESHAAGSASVAPSPSGPQVANSVPPKPSIAQSTAADDKISSKTTIKEDTCQGDPVSMVSGEELLPVTDFTLPGPIAFEWQRTYRSSNSDDHGLGHGWTHPLCEHLTLEDKFVHYHTLEGRSVRFVRPSIGHARRNRSEKLTLVRHSEHGYQIIERQKPKRVFRADGVNAQLPMVELRDEFNNSISIDYQHGRPRKLVTSWGRVLEFTCNASRLIERIDAPGLGTEGKAATLAQYQFDEHGDLTAATEVSGATEHYAYNNHVIVKRTTHAGVNFLFEWDEHTPQARCQRQWSDNGAYDYRFKWQPKRKISYSTDSNGKTHQYHYNEYGKVVKEIDPEGGVTKRLYDSYGNLCSETNPNGHNTYYRYDNSGQVTRITNALGHTTKIRYSEYGQPALITDALGNHWQRRYNSRGLLSETRDPMGNAWRYSYNDKGQLETIIDPEDGKRQLSWNSQFELLSETDADGRTTHYDYDQWGRIQQVTNPAGQSTQYEYDIAGRITTVTDATGNITRLSYNEAGQVTQHTDSDNRTTHYQYGGFSQVETRTDPNGQRFDYQYDKERNLTGLTNEKGEQYQLKYDGNERLIEEVGFDGRQQHYRYNAAGHLVEHRDVDVITQFGRDPMGRLLRKSNNSGDVAEFHYDALGRLTAANNDDAFVRYQYDQSGRLIAEHSDTDHADHTSGQTPANHSLRHSYDKRGWKLSTGTDNQHVQYQYTPSGQLYGVDHNGKPVIRCEYDATGRLSQKTQGELTSRFDYDPMGRLSQQSVGRSNNKNPVIQRDYKYNSAGNLQQIEDLLRGLTQYHYDGNDQLTQVDGAIKEAFAFDPAGNLLQNNDGQTGYTKGNRLAFHGDRHFEYDQRGNLLSEKRGKNQQLEVNYQYNGWNQLASVEKGDFRTYYRYDALGRRIGKTITHLKSKQQKKTTFCWNGDVLWSETNHTPKGTDSQHYLFEPNSFRPLALIKNDEIHHYHLDHLGTPQEITNETGDIVWQAHYKAYGQLAGFADKPGLSNPLRFQGQYFDSETGLHYNRHRYYDPSVGRFTNQDPVGLLGGNNCYQYAPNPVGWVDPLGLTCKELTAAEESAAYQGSDPYFGIDPLKDVAIKKGTTLAHITYRTDGVITGNYFTEPGAVEICRAIDGVVSSKALNQGVQVYAGDGRLEYKKYVQVFEVQEDIPHGGSAFGKTKANPQFNPGRYQTHNQYFIKAEQHSKLTAVSGSLETMKDTEAPDLTDKLTAMRSKKPA